MKFHRTTWIAVPIVGLTLISAGVGWWGYDQYREKQALLYQSESQYANTFHNLVSNMQNTQIQLAETQISLDPATFQQHLRTLWRLNYAAQQEMGRLPLALMPMHTTQAFLAIMSKSVEQWMNDSAQATNPAVQKQLQTYYNESGQLRSQLVGLQEKVIDGNLQWLAVNQALTKQHEDNQIIDGFHKLDTVSTAFTESKYSPNSLHRKSQTRSLSTEPIVTGQQAAHRLARFLGSDNWKEWSVVPTGKGAARPDYLIHGTYDGSTLTGAVSQHGGHIIDFQIIPTTTLMNQKLNFDVLQAQNIALKFARDRDLPPLYMQHVQQFDNQVYLTLNPRYQGIPVMSQAIAFKVSLTSGKVIQYDASQYYDYPLNNLPQRKFSTSQLEQKLNKDFLIKQKWPAIVLDDQHHYQPVSVFDGVVHNETYRVFVNAATGREMHVDLLSTL